MVGWRDLPPRTPPPPDGGYRGALARHVRHVRPVGDDGVFLLFHDRLGRVISSTSTSTSSTPHTVHPRLERTDKRPAISAQFISSPYRFVTRPLGVSQSSHAIGVTVHGVCVRMRVKTMGLIIIRTY
jgi:hypothetical protein